MQQQVAEGKWGTQEALAVPGHPKGSVNVSK